MNSLDFLKSTNEEFSLLQNRVRHFIGQKHFPTDGEWKESILRSVLRRHASANLTIGRGFLVWPDYVSRQIDVLIRYGHKPLLHQDGDLVVATLDAAAAVIEVKTSYDAGQAKTVADTLGTLRSERLSKTYGFISDCHKFSTGFFVYAEPSGTPQICKLLTILAEVAQGHWQKGIDHAVFGADVYVRREQSTGGRECFRAYRLEGVARAVFIHAFLYEFEDEAKQDPWPPWLPPIAELGELISEATSAPSTPETHF